jgi:hypothetical protein
MNTPLLNVVGSEVEASRLKFLHSGNSKGPFIRVSSGGVIVMNGSEITTDTSRYGGIVYFIYFMTFLVHLPFTHFW